MVGTWLARMTHSPELRGVQLGLGVRGVTKMILNSNYLLDLKSDLMGMLVLMSSTTLSLGLT